MKPSVVIGVAFALIGLTSCGKGGTTLEFKPAAGSVRTIDLSQATSTSMGLGDGDMTTLTDYTFDLAAESVDASGTVNLKATIVSYKQEKPGAEAMLKDIPPQLKQQMGDDPFGEKAMKKAMDSIKGETFTLRVDKSGHLLEVTGADAIADKVSGQLNTEGDPMAGLTGTVVKQQLGDRAMTEIMRAAFPAQPDIPLKAGEKRHAKNVINAEMMPVTEELNITVREHSGTSLVADVQCTYSIDMKEMMAAMDEQMKEFEKQMADNPMFKSSGFNADDFKAEMKKIMSDPEMKPSLTGNGTGTITFDSSTGWVIDSSVAGQMSGDIDATFKTTVKSYPK